MLPRESKRKRICVAKIGAAHGVRGEVKFWSFTSDPPAVANLGPLETADGRLVEIETLRQAKDFLVARLKGISDRNTAESLCNLELYISRDRLPELKEADEFYHSDLIGLAAVNSAGVHLGAVIAIHNFGAGDIIEIQPAYGEETVMLPFTQTFVPHVDIEAGRIVVESKGYFSENERGIQ